MVDVGQGDSIFLRSMKGDTILIDVGVGDFRVKGKWQEASQTSNAEKTLIPYLRLGECLKLDHLVLTHTDTDHIGDLEEVANGLRLRKSVSVKALLTKLVL